MLRDDQSFVSGTPRLILRLEGFCLLAGSLWAFQVQHAGWALFAVLFFAPDLSMLGYLVNPKIGAAAYNAAHTTVVYGPLAVYGYLWFLSRACGGAYRTGACGLRPPPGLRPEISTRLWLHTSRPHGKRS